MNRRQQKHFWEWLTHVVFREQAFRHLELPEEQEMRFPPPPPRDGAA